MTETAVIFGHITENSSDLNFVIDRFEYGVLSIMMEGKQTNSDLSLKFVNVV